MAANCPLYTRLIKETTACGKLASKMCGMTDVVPYSRPMSTRYSGDFIGLNRADFRLSKN